MQFGSKVRIENKKVSRTVNDIFEAKKIIEALKKVGSIANNVVETEVVLNEDNVLEHAYIPQIIHSGEFTESMAYDVNKVALTLNRAMYEQGIYSFDLLPHNFTYYGGKWVLFDFGAFETSSENVKTLIRNFFKITFSSFELLSIITRKDLKHYFLNRIRTEKLKKMIPLAKWLQFFIQSQLALLLCALKLHDLAYSLVEYIFKKYCINYDGVKRKDFEPEENRCLFDFLNNLVLENSIKTVFGTGLLYANWSLKSDSALKNFVYIDDYEKCDSYYKYIYANNVENISTAVLYPFVDDEIINKDIKYRALYDSYAQRRFKSEACFVLNFDDFFIQEHFNIESFCENISKFIEKMLVLRVDETFKELDIVKSGLKKYFREITISNIDNNVLIIAKEPINIDFDGVIAKEYNNDNRMQLESIHTEKIIEILKNKKL